MRERLLLKLWLSLCVCGLSEIAFAQLPFPTNRFPVIANGMQLEINDGSGRRFFLAGMVHNSPPRGTQLSLYDHDAMEAVIVAHKAIGATAMRWNTFLFGKDLRWDADGYVTGMSDGAVANIKDALDLAYQHGIVIQIVLSTAHFLRYGWGGATPENVTRVNNNWFMFTDAAATQAYIDHVIKPITQTIGVHPGLFGYCLINEAYGMYDDGWSDVKVHKSDFQKWVNRVASEIHNNQPGAIRSVSGVAARIGDYADAALIAAGGKTNGIMDIHQVQYYPAHHTAAWSPFLHTPQEFIDSYGGGSKPIICGETPIRDNAFPLEECYTRLYTNGFSGGFTWQYDFYANPVDAEDKLVIDAAYSNFYNTYLWTNDFNRKAAAPTATLSVGQVDLVWSAVADATSYNVKRTTVAGGPYTTIGMPSDASFTDTTVTNGMTYYYVVSAVVSGIESSDSDEVAAVIRHVIPFTEDFEALVLGGLAGQNGWAASNAVVQTNMAFGVQAGSITSETGFVEQIFAGSETNVWSDFKIQTVFSEGEFYPGSLDGSSILYFNTNGNPVAYDNTNAVIFTDVQVAAGDWVRVTIHGNYANKTWDLYIDGASAGSGLGFYNTAFSRYERFRVSGSCAMLDDVWIGMDSPLVPQLTDYEDWLVTHYGSTNDVDDSSLCANGINTIIEAYIIGINPTNATERFTVSGVWDHSGAMVLNWDSVSGRLYNVYWSSNLLDGFASFLLLGSNIHWNANSFTDTVHSTYDAGFYRINVQLE